MYHGLSRGDVQLKTPKPACAARLSVASSHSVKFGETLCNLFWGNLTWESPLATALPSRRCLRVPFPTLRLGCLFVFRGTDLISCTLSWRCPKTWGRLYEVIPGGNFVSYMFLLSRGIILAKRRAGDNRLVPLRRPRTWLRAVRGEGGSRVSFLEASCKQASKRGRARVLCWRGCAWSAGVWGLPTPQPRSKAKQSECSLKNEDTAYVRECALLHHY